MGFPGGSANKESEPGETQVQSLDQEDPVEKEMAAQLQYSCLENFMGKGAWWATVREVTETWTWLSYY